MKQHITVEQLNKLSKKGKKKLQKWWKLEVGELAFNTVAKREVTIDALHAVQVEIDGKVPWYVFLPLLSVGQMIEFLEEKTVLDEEFIYAQWDSINDCSSWAVNCDGEEYRNKELCDALWEKVKEVLAALDSPKEGV